MKTKKHRMVGSLDLSRSCALQARVALASMALSLSAGMIVVATGAKTAMAANEEADSASSLFVIVDPSQPVPSALSDFLGNAMQNEGEEAVTPEIIRYSPTHPRLQSLGLLSLAEIQKKDFPVVVGIDENGKIVGAPIGGSKLANASEYRRLFAQIIPSSLGSSATALAPGSGSGSGSAKKPVAIPGVTGSKISGDLNSQSGNDPYSLGAPTAGLPKGQNLAALPPIQPFSKETTPCPKLPGASSTLKTDSPLWKKPEALCFLSVAQLRPETSASGEGNLGCMEFQVGNEQGFINYDPPFISAKASFGQFPNLKTGLCVLTAEGPFFQPVDDSVWGGVSDGKGGRKPKEVLVSVEFQTAKSTPLKCGYLDYSAIVPAGAVPSDQYFKNQPPPKNQNGVYSGWRSFQCVRASAGDAKTVPAISKTKSFSEPNCLHFFHTATLNRLKSLDAKVKGKPLQGEALKTVSDKLEKAHTTCKSTIAEQKRSRPKDDLSIESWFNTTKSDLRKPAAVGRGKSDEDTAGGTAD